MKRLKKLIPLLLLVAFGCCMTVSAEETKNDALIQWRTSEDQKGAAITVAPTQEMTENAVTAMQITMQVVDVSEKISDVTVTFNEAVTDAYRIADYTYKADENELHIFLSDSKMLFGKDAKSCTIGTVNISTDATEYQVSIYPTSVQTVSQSHVTDFMESQELQQMAVTLTPAGGTEPAPPDSGAVFDKVSDVITELKEGQAAEVTFNIGKDGKLSAEDQTAVFQALKGRNKSLTFAVRDDSGKVLYSFTFRGEQITDADLYLDFKLNIGVSNRAIEGLLEKDAKSLILEFAHSGKFPGTAEIKVSVGTPFTEGEKLYLYYYNPDSKKLEPVQKDIIVVDGYATFELTHCSSYVLTTKEVKEAGSFPAQGEQTSQGNAGDTKNTKQTGVQTGDTSQVTLYVVLALAAFIAIVVAIYRKKRK